MANPLARLASLFRAPQKQASAVTDYNDRLIGAGSWKASPRWREHTQSIRNEVSTFEWRTIVSSANKLYWNFGPVAGAIEDKAIYSIGRAWQPKFEGADKEWGKIATEWLVGQFYPVAYVNGLDFVSGLYLDSISVDRDGDVGTIYAEASTGFPQLQQIPWHAIGSREWSEVVTSGPYKGLKQYNGVIFNSYGRPVAYRILGATAAQDVDISARDMDFLAEPRTPDQARGFPAFTNAIMDLRDLMTTQTYVKQAAMLAASIGLIEHNETGGADPLDPSYALNNEAQDNLPAAGVHVETVAGATTRYFRAGAGAKLEQLQNSSPSEATERLMERLIRNALIGAGMPPEFYWKPEGSGANVRMIVAKVNRTVQDRQDLIRNVAKRRVGWAVSKAVKLGILPEYKGADLGGSLKWDFTMPPVLTSDAGYQGQDTRESYKLGFRNKSEVLAENGTTFEAHQEEREREIYDTLDRAGRIASKYGIGLDMALSLFEQRSATGNAPGGMFGNSLTVEDPADAEDSEE